MVEVVSATVVARVRQVPAAKASPALSRVVVNVGRPGTWGVDRAFLLKQIVVPIDQGKIVLDLKQANTFLLVLDQHVHTIEYANVPPAGTSARIQVYVEQNGLGHWTLEGWPPSTRTPGGIFPDFSYDPGRRDSFVLDTFDGGETVHLNLVGLDYKPLT
jgi:hypothetical protein